MAPVEEVTQPAAAGGYPSTSKSERSSLLKYIEDDLNDIITEYDALWIIEDPEETPYKTKYKARMLLQKAVKEIEKMIRQNPQDPAADLGREWVARLLLYLGKNFYHCEEVPAAEQHFNRSLERYLRSPHRLEPKQFIHTQDCLNQLGMLWCNRHGHAQGFNYLRRAQVMFANRPAAIREQVEEQAKNSYTLTMFYLAQAYGALKKPGLSARFCAETMSQQLEHNAPGVRSKEVLEKDPFDCKDWVRNCCSLSDFFANECMFWTAEYLLHAGIVMCERCEELFGLKPDNIKELHAECQRDLGILYATRLKFARTCTEHPQICEAIWRGDHKGSKTLEDEQVDAESKQGSRLSFRSAGEPESKPSEGGSGDIIWDDVFPEVVYVEDEEAADNKLAEETEHQDDVANDVDAELIRGAGWLQICPGERVRLPVFFECLHTWVERRIHRANSAFIGLRGDVYQAAKEAIATVSVPHSDDKAESSTDVERHRMPSCAATKFEPIREIFKMANHYFVQALSYFVLDGFVTEHVKILQELSQMYRTMHTWERDPKRLVAMMNRRVQMLAPLLDVLNPKAYIAFVRQLAFEVAEVFQEIYDLKVKGKLPGRTSAGIEADADSDAEDENLKPSQIKRIARCNELARKSVTYFSMFVDSYHMDGKVPDKVDDDHARAYLMARLNRARLRSKLRGLSIDDQIEMQRLALREYEWMLDYAVRHPQVVTSPDIAMEKELDFCQEMVGMLPSKLSRLSARRR